MHLKHTSEQNKADCVQSVQYITEQESGFSPSAAVSSVVFFFFFFGGEKMKLIFYRVTLKKPDAKETLNSYLMSDFQNICPGQIKRLQTVIM